MTINLLKEVSSDQEPPDEIAFSIMQRNVVNRMQNAMNGEHYQKKDHTRECSD